MALLPIEVFHNKYVPIYLLLIYLFYSQPLFLKLVKSFKNANLEEIDHF
jgi:hypothetical protein